MNEGEFKLFSKEFIDYKSKLHLVSDKINQWHLSIKEKNNKEFMFDADFLDIQMPSPNDFFEKSEESSDESPSSNTNSSNLTRTPNRL